MAQAPRISESEWKVMEVLWANSPLSSNEVIQTLAAENDWHPNTIKTFLARLHKKKVLSVKKEKNYYLFQPRFTQEQCVQAESDSFLDQVFGGSVRPLLTHFVGQYKLSTQDLNELRQALKSRTSGK